MANEERLARDIEEYAKIGKEHKDVNVASLMIHALEQAQRDEIEESKKKKAYMVSVFLPPLGYFFALWYAFSDKPDGKKVAVNCVIITSVTLLLTFLIGKAIFASVPDNTGAQLQNINVTDLLQQTKQLQQ